jgi:hypothetical protein
MQMMLKNWKGDLKKSKLSIHEYAKFYQIPMVQNPWEEEA